MKNNTIKFLLTSMTCLTLAACNGFFDKDNTPTPTPLAQFTPAATTHLVWNSGVNAGVGADYLKLIPAVGEQAIYSADKDGQITASNKLNGATLWRKSLNMPLSSGPAASHGLVVVGSRKGNVVALDQQQGNIIWQTQLSSEILSPPAAEQGVVLIKTIDGQLTALQTQTGRVLWRYQQTEPALILRGGSAPQVSGNVVISGFANGKLAKLTLDDGSLLWEQTIAVPQGSFAIQRMVDINANPFLFKNRVYAATYQGNIAALELQSGRTLWTHDISSYTGLAVDNEKVYVADATGYLWAFDTETGAVDWRQTQLAARNITGPAIMGNYIVVGDEEGYLHWLSKQDGHFVARTQVSGDGIIASPIIDNNMLYVLTKNGHIAAYTVG